MGNADIAKLKGMSCNRSKKSDGWFGMGLFGAKTAGEARQENYPSRTRLPPLNVLSPFVSSGRKSSTITALPSGGVCPTGPTNAGSIESTRTGPKTVDPAETVGAELIGYCATSDS